MSKKSTILITISALILGYFIRYLNEPDPTIITKTQIEYVDKEKIVYVEQKNIKTKKSKTTNPDGTVIETEETVDLSKTDILGEKEKTLKQEQTQIISPRKRFYGGAMMLNKGTPAAQGAIHLGKDILINGHIGTNGNYGLGIMIGF